ncbi:DUF5675 family protein [Vibrio parahaemolyticus]|nr:DUF5675 family protein [Vibrio parahaemolyticus]
MSLILKRIANIPSQGMFGEIWLDGEFYCYTIEREWLDNKACVSCIPVGEYELESHMWKGQFLTVALVGGTVSHYAEPGKARSTILMHWANTQSEIQGCIACGSRLGYVHGKWAVTSSKRTTKRLLDIIFERNIKTITIEGPYETY